MEIVAKYTLEINGMTFELKKEDLEKLRNQLDTILGKDNSLKWNWPEQETLKPPSYPTDIWYSLTL